VTRGSQIYVITGRMYFWYVRFKFDWAHPHLLPARRFRTFVRSESREAIFSLACWRRSLRGTWIHLIGRELYLYPSTLNVLFCELGRRDWKAVFETFIFILFLSHHSSSMANALLSVCSVFLQPFFYLPQSRRQGHLHIVNIWCQG